MKRIFCIICVVALLLCSCGTESISITSSEDKKEEEKIETYGCSDVIHAKITGNNFTRVKNCAVGGGGFVTGMVIHPKNPDLMYIRTDVGGIYRWEAKKQEWKQLLHNMPGDCYGVEGMGIDPQNENILFAVLGTLGLSGLYKSTDKGETWKKVYGVWGKGNEWGKEWGEPVAVDPVNSNIVYCGTRKQGLLQSTDGGETWKAISTINGIRCITFDKNTAKVGKTQTIYFSSMDSGLFRSTDAGETWAKVEKIPAACKNIRIADDSTLFVTAGNGLYRIKNEKITKITPKGMKTVPRGLAVDTSDPNRIAVTGTASAEAKFSIPIYYTTDGGKTWTNIAVGEHKSMVPWWPAYYFSADTSSLNFGKDRTFYYTDWYGVWKTENVDAGEDIKWTTIEKGHEEMCTFYALSTPSNTQQLIVSQADNCLLRFRDDVDTYPEKREANGQFLDYFVQDPEFLVCAGGTDNNGQNGKVWYYEDGKWHTCSNWDSSKLTHSVAVSSDRREVFVVDVANRVPYYTEDKGETWYPSAGAPKSTTNSYWSRQKILASDRVIGNIFYYMAGDGFYRSDDYGKTWNKVSDIPAGGGEVLTRDGAAGDIWVSCEKGIFHSVDYGETWTYIYGPSGYIALGKGSDDNNYTVWILGKIGKSKKAVYYSTDEGETFTCATDFEEDNLEMGITIFGDVKKFGRAYIGSHGYGWMYIDLE